MEMTLRDYDVHREEIINKLSPDANKVFTYLNILHRGNKGKKGNAHVGRMEFVLNIPERRIRHLIREIIEKNKAIIGNKNGYYIAVTKEEIEKANNHEVSRIKSSLTRLAQNNGSFGEIYKRLNELKEKYPHIAIGQLDITGNEEKKTPNRPK